VSTHLAVMEGVYKSYGKVAALDGVDLQIRSGEVLALLGPNGAGKTTAISMMLGLQQPDAGHVELLGDQPQSMEARRGIGVMMQEVFLARELKVHELVNNFASYYPDPYEPEEVLELTNTTSLARQYYGKLSGGQMRQVQFAIAMCGRPRLLFLDEPTVGLDVQARQTLWAALRQCIGRGCSILLTTHYLEEAEALADRVVVLAKGRVVSSGSVTEITKQVATRTIKCTTTLAVEAVSAWPGVITVKSEGGRLCISANHEQVGDVVRELLAADGSLTDLEVSRAGLEEAFLQITKENLQ
jgi:ABC-2 type transport system ATP-binding protein